MILFSLLVMFSDERVSSCCVVITGEKYDSECSGLILRPGTRRRSSIYRYVYIIYFLSLYGAYIL